MAGSSYLLDTNIMVGILNQEAILKERLEGITAYLPSIGVGELYYGAYKSLRVADNLKSIEAFIVDYPILACDQTTGDVYGKIKATLIVKGRPLPENDIWIAAIARQHDLTLVTRDDHFNEINDLKTDRW